MPAEPPIEVPPGWAGRLRFAGLLLVLSGVLYGAVTYLGMAIYNFGGVPTDAATYLRTVGPHAALAATTWSIWIGLDVLLVPITLALYVLLRGQDRYLAMLGAGLLGAYVVFDIAVTELDSLRLAALASGYTAASSADQGSYVTSAGPLLSGLPLETLLSFVVGSFGFVLLSLLLLHGPVRRGTALFGVGVNSLGIVGGIGAVLPALSVTTSPSLLLIGLWYVLTGAQLYRWASVAVSTARGASRRAGPESSTPSPPTGPGGRRAAIGPPSSSPGTTSRAGEVPIVRGGPSMDDARLTSPGTR